jgi:hypothetical protein
MAVVVAETGYGKSRLVQELYLRLTADAQWDPPEFDYWPAAFGEIGAQLRVTPVMEGHIAKGPPRFLWLGARWRPTDERNVETRSALTELRDEFTTHLRLLEKHKDAWARVLDATRKTLRKNALGEVLSQAADHPCRLVACCCVLQEARAICCQSEVWPHTTQCVNPQCRTRSTI